MFEFETLERHLEAWAGDDPGRADVAGTVSVIADTCRVISGLIARGPLDGALGALRGTNKDGDAQKELDLQANDLLIEALRAAPVAHLVSEECEDAVVLSDGAPLCVIIDPLDGSSNIDTNISLGTIFSVLPASAGNGISEAPHVLQPGSRQLAAGYAIYGPQTALVLTVGAGTQIFTLDPDAGEFRLTGAGVRIAEDAREFAINASNFRHWDRNIRGFIDECLRGELEWHGTAYNMRWVASLVAECHRILSRGGIFLYPADKRTGYANGRLRLLYEANPIAWLVEQAGGAASTGRERILEIVPTDIHQRVPLIFGSRMEVERIERSYARKSPGAEQAALFGQRGLFRS